MNLHNAPFQYGLEFLRLSYSSLYNPSKMSWDGIFVIDNKIPSHFESNSWMSSFRRTTVNWSLHNSRQNCWSQWPGSILDQASYLSSSEETIFLVSFHFLQTGLILGAVFWMILFNAEAILASSNSKFGPGVPVIEREDLRSSTESTISTSLIHSIASAGNCEQVHTSVLNLIFQRANVVGEGNLSKWRSEICNLCWFVT